AAHVRECSEFREAYADYSRILRQDLPQADPARFRSKQNSLHPATDTRLSERIVARARAHGADFSPEIEGVIKVDRKPVRLLRMRFAVAGAAAAFAIAAGVTLAYVLHDRKTMEAPSANVKALRSQNESLQRELEKATSKVVALSN